MENNSAFPAILGVGNALVDIMIALPGDDILQQFGLPRGSMTLVDGIQSWKIYQATHPWQKNVTTGGSAANTIHNLASLGARCGYAGKIGHDDLGAIFEKEFTDKGVTTHLYYSSSGTGRVMALVSPDSERTMATCLGAAARIAPRRIFRRNHATLPLPLCGRVPRSGSRTDRNHPAHRTRSRPRSGH